jgi:hypothetical protein
VRNTSGITSWSPLSHRTDGRGTSRLAPHRPGHPVHLGPGLSREHAVWAVAEAGYRALRAGKATMD